MRGSDIVRNYYNVFYGDCFVDCFATRNFENLAEAMKSLRAMRKVYKLLKRDEA